MNKIVIGLLALAGCSTQEELGLSPHLLTAQPGCWTPETGADTNADTSTEPSPATGDAFAQMMAATRQMAQFQLAFSIQRHGLILDKIRAEPDADAWSVELGTASHRAGLVSGGEEPGSTSTSGTLTIPGRAPGLSIPAASSRLVRIEANVLERSADRLNVSLEIVDAVCTSESVCTEQSALVLLRVTPSLSTLELPAQVIAWNDDSVSIRSRVSGDEVPFLRGCDPTTGASFERRIGVTADPFHITSELACWDTMGAGISCDTVDLTPGF